RADSDGVAVSGPWPVSVLLGAVLVDARRHRCTGSVRLVHDLAVQRGGSSVGQVRTRGYRHVCGAVGIPARPVHVAVRQMTSGRGRRVVWPVAASVTPQHRGTSRVELAGSTRLELATSGVT